MACTLYQKLGCIIMYCIINCSQLHKAMFKLSAVTIIISQAIVKYLEFHMVQIHIFILILENRDKEAK